MSERPWFRTRESGLGWTPITWQGWLITFGSMAVVMALNVAVLAWIGVVRL